MVRKNFTLRGCVECHPNGQQSPLGAWLSRRTKLLNARAAVTAVDDSKQKAVLEKALFSAMLQHTVKVDNTRLSGPELGHSQRPSPVVLLARLQNLKQVILMLLRNRAELILDFVDLQDGELAFLTFLGRRFEKANGDLLPGTSSSIGTSTTSSDFLSTSVTTDGCGSTDDAGLEPTEILTARVAVEFRAYQPLM